MPKIAILPGESHNLIIRRHHSASEIDVAPSPPLHQWFAGTFTHLPTAGETTIHLRMDGNDTGGHKADCKKWLGLKPLFTYADPARYDTFIWYRRNGHGRWISGDLTQPAVDAGHGRLPVQTVLPAALAEECLAPDGRTWSPWREVEQAEIDLATKTLTLRHPFAQPRATLAMHVPYTNGYLRTFISRLEQQAYPGVTVDTVDITDCGFPLQVIRLDDPAHPTPLRWETGVRADGTPTRHPRLVEAPGAPKHPVMLVIAREHGTEHTASWVLQGVLRRLLEDSASAHRLRAGYTWLLVPLCDPDSAATNNFHLLTSRFFPHQQHHSYGSDTPHEVIAYARYMRAFINSGRVMPMVTSLYGLECNEGAPVCCPFAIRNERDLAIKFNRYLYTRLTKEGILCGKPEPWSDGWAPHRLSGWCEQRFGAQSVTLEVGDRHPQCPLDLHGLERIGMTLASTLGEFQATSAGKTRLRATCQFLKHRHTERQLWFNTSMAGTPEEPTLYDLLGLGY